MPSSDAALKGVPGREAGGREGAKGNGRSRTGRPALKGREAALAAAHGAPACSDPEGAGTALSSRRVLLW